MSPALLDAAPAVLATTSVDDAVGGLTGLSGALARFIAAIGEPGVFVATVLETVVPPVPSEVTLPLAGFIAAQGGMDLVLALVAATLGSLVGALALYAAGRALGEQRAVAVMARIPFVDREEVEHAVGWFHRHGGASVFFGRLVPGVRSLVSIPAGTTRMPLLRFCLLTGAGSLLWNALLVGGGYALGSQFERVEEYAQYLDHAFIAVLVVLLALFVRSRVRRARARGDVKEAL
ncbi:DedA family protein [uncultured Pseudokineococcus sp.]|uniref:DedA family protein n=1 Tax=uncultured Pseudokineococcus sp. TaxID=1642928 RepID=UPI00263866B9|nr:DedA family protein [uncultured Pseudokineococcus sp.]